MTLRTTVFDALVTDGTLSTMGLTTENLFPNWVADSPAAEFMKWGVIRWGSAEVPPGRDTTARARVMDFWVYNRERDFDFIDDALGRVRQIMEQLAGMTWPGGAFFEASFAGCSDDLWDPGYEAVMRYDTYRVVSSGI